MTPSERALTFKQWVRKQGELKDCLRYCWPKADRGLILELMEESWNASYYNYHPRELAKRKKRVKHEG